MLSLFSIKGALLLTLVAIGAILTFWKPKYGVMTFIVLLFARDSFLMWYFPDLYSTLHLPLVFGVLTFISWIIHKEDLPLKFPLQMKLMLSFFIIIWLSILLSQTENYGNPMVEEFFRMCMLFFLIINTIKDHRSLKQVLWTVIIINFILTAYHYYNYKTGWESIFIFPTFRGLNRNGFAAALAAVAGLSFSMSRGAHNKIIKMILIFCLITFICGVVLTYSRAGALALAVTIGLCALSGKRKALSISLIVILLLIIGSRISDKYFGNLETIGEYQTDASAMGRVATNIAAIEMLKSHPLLGVGAGNYPRTFIDYVPGEMLLWVGPGKNIHNIMLQVASETGIVGLAIFSLLVASTFMSILKLRKLCFKDVRSFDVGYSITGVGIALFGYFAAMQFGQGAYYGYLYIYMPLAIAATYVYKGSMDGTNNNSGRSK